MELSVSMVRKESRCMELYVSMLRKGEGDIV